MIINEFEQRDYKTGETFEEDGIRLVAVEVTDCKNCFFYDKTCGDLACTRCNRDDEKEVIFVPAKNQQGTHKDMGEVSDGYHTFNELYEYRKVYNAAFFNELAKQGKGHVVKSKRHHDGKECFDGGWFIVMAELPTGQISNHYELKDWDLFQCQEVETAPEWDGHTPQDVVKRITEYLKLK